MVYYGPVKKKSCKEAITSSHAAKEGFRSFHFNLILATIEHYCILEPRQAFKSQLQAVVYKTVFPF